MVKTVIAVLIPENECEAIASLLNNELPTTYSGWLENSAKENAKVVANGNILKEVVVNEQDLISYCGGDIN